MVMPRSRSMSMESSTCSVISRAVSPPVIWISRSASVDLPWSIWATMEKLRMLSNGKRGHGARDSTRRGALQGLAPWQSCAGANFGRFDHIVMAGLVPGHPRLSCRAAKTWMPGIRAGMTGRF